MPISRMRFLIDVYFRRRTGAAVVVLAVWPLAQVYDFGRSQVSLNPEKWPRLHDALGWLPLWGWMLLVVSVVMVIGLEGAYQKVREVARNSDTVLRDTSTTHATAMSRVEMERDEARARVSALEHEQLVDAKGERATGEAKRRSQRIELANTKAGAQSIAKQLDDSASTPEAAADDVNAWYANTGEWISEEFGEDWHGEFATGSGDLPFLREVVPRLSRQDIKTALECQTRVLDRFMERLL